MYPGPSRSLPDLSLFVQDGLEGNDIPSTPPPNSPPSPASSSSFVSLDEATLDSTIVRESYKGKERAIDQAVTPRSNAPLPPNPLRGLGLQSSISTRTLSHDAEHHEPKERSQSESPFLPHRRPSSTKEEDAMAYQVLRTALHQPRLARNHSDAFSVQSAPLPHLLSPPPSPPATELTPTAHRSPSTSAEQSPTRMRERRRATSEESEYDARSATPENELDEGDEKRRKGIKRIPFSLWDYLQEEVLAVEMEGEEGVKAERVTNFLTVPGEVEKIILFGFVICLDSFLYTFTILPLRSLTALLQLLRNTFSNLSSLFSRTRKYKHLRLSHKCDIVKVALLVGTVIILQRMTDASQMYHSVRGQETIKLYVIFNVLEIADRLCCSFGQDLQDSLFSKQTLSRRTDGSHPRTRPVALFALNLAYVVAHTLVLFYQLVTLNVAINSYNNALLTLLLSNQFVEIKSAVFKKFEKEQLFQVTCADIVERFQLALMLFIIALRNLIELSSASSSSLFSFLPLSFSLSLSIPSLPTLSLIQTIFSPALMVLLSECAVDWLKHAFITKFNHIRPAVYGRFIDVLCKDLVGGGGKRKDQPFVDQSPLVARRLGFASLPLGCLVLRVIFQAFEMMNDDSHIDECAPTRSLFAAIGSGGLVEGALERDWWGIVGRGVVGVLGAVFCWACLVALKLIIGINLRSYASARYANVGLRIKEDQLNDRSRPHIGVTESEKVLEREVAYLLGDGDFDVPGKLKGGKIDIEKIGRYDMLKSRVW